MTMATIKKKRVSKKSKLSWRKHVNINDVEDFLEDKRLEERLGPPLSTVTNADLFVVDSKPQELSAREKKRLKLLEPPKCFQILQPHTKVPDPITKRNRVRTKAERKNVLIKNKEEINRAKGILKRRELQAHKDRVANKVKNENKYKRGDFKQNIWEEEEKLAIEKDEWVTDITKRHNLVGVGKLRKTVKTPIKKNTSVTSAVEPPHPGMSYNPSYDDHQDLLKLVAEKESVIMKNDAHLNRVTRDMFSRMSEEKRDESWLTEMSQGLSKVPEEAESEVEEDETPTRPVKNVKKTLQQRRKQKEQLKLALGKKAMKVQKKKTSDIHQLRFLKKQIETQQSKTEVLREKRLKVRAIKSKETKRLAARKFEEPELEFNMGQDISGNLRNLKTEGSLLGDRFKSLQKRNIVEPTVLRHRKKAKVKKYTKPGHKEDWKQTVAR